MSKRKKFVAATAIGVACGVFFSLVGFWGVNIFAAGVLTGTTVLSRYVGQINDVPMLRDLRSRMQAMAVLAIILNLIVGVVVAVL